jgi:hypothetical protein
VTGIWAARLENFGSILGREKIFLLVIAVQTGTHIQWIPGPTYPRINSKHSLSSVAGD